MFEFGSIFYEKRDSKIIKNIIWYVNNMNLLIVSYFLIPDIVLNEVVEENYQNTNFLCFPKWMQTNLWQVETIESIKTQFL